MSLISILKKLPIDIGQAQRKHDSAGKRIAFSYVEDGEGKRALDIGCRDGYWSDRLKEKNYSVIALDLEPQYEGAITCNVEDGLPFDDESFDIVWCTEVIEHVYKPEFLLQEVDRILKPGGTAVLTTPNSAWWFYPLVKLWGWTPKKLQNPDHKQFFDICEMKKLAPKYQILGYFPYAFFFLPIRSLVGPLSPTFILVQKKPKREQV
jgi:SAM-dependent methyltransferase